MNAITQQIAGIKDGFPFGVRFLSYQTGNQTSRINEALNVLQTRNGGGTLILDVGMWIAEDIEVPSNTILKGSGMGLTVIESPTTTGGVTIIRNKDRVNGNDNIIISDLTADGKRTDGSTNGDSVVDFSIGQNIQLLNITAKNGHKHNIEFQHIQKGFMSNCHIVFDTDYNHDDGISISDFDQLANGKRTKDITLIGCTYDAPSPVVNIGSGIEVDDGPHNVRIIACTSKQAGNGFLVHIHENAPSTQNIVFDSCVAENCDNGFTAYQRNSAEIIKNVTYINCISKDDSGLGRGFRFINIDTPTLPLENIDVINCKAQGHLNGITNKIAKSRVVNCDFEECNNPYFDMILDADQIQFGNRPAYPTQ